MGKFISVSLEVPHKVYVLLIFKLDTGRDRVGNAYFCKELAYGLENNHLCKTVPLVFLF
jgi:hypothetical protein